jgi:hypothetical protein
MSLAQISLRLKNVPGTNVYPAQIPGVNLSRSKCVPGTNVYPEQICPRYKKGIYAANAHLHIFGQKYFWRFYAFFCIFRFWEADQWKADQQIG